MRAKRDAIYDHFYTKEKDIITGIVQRYVGNNINVSLDDKTEAILKKSLRWFPAKYITEVTVSNYM